MDKCATTRTSKIRRTHDACIMIAHDYPWGSGLREPVIGSISGERSVAVSNSPKRRESSRGVLGVQGQLQKGGVVAESEIHCRMESGGNYPFPVCSVQFMRTASTCCPHDMGDTKHSLCLRFCRVQIAPKKLDHDAHIFVHVDLEVDLSYTKHILCCEQVRDILDVLGVLNESSPTSTTCTKESFSTLRAVAV